VSAELFHSIRSTQTAGEMSSKLGITVEAQPGVKSIITETYTYFATPFQNHARYMNATTELSERYFGVGLGKLLMPNVIAGQLAKSRLSWLDLDSYLTSFANTYPSITYMYAEGGWIGVILETLIVSVFVCYLYNKMIIRFSVLNISLYAIAVSRIWAWMFCGNNFAGLQYYFSLAVCVAVSYFVKINPAKICK
jgi:hypothetical protein